MSDRTNTVDLQCRVFNVKELAVTRNEQKQVCNARINVAGKFEDEWHTVWFELTAWEDAARTLADCQHGDDVIIRGGRLGAKAYRKRDGEIVVEPTINCNKLEKIGSYEPAPSTPVRSTPADMDDVPF